MIARVLPPEEWGRLDHPPALPGIRPGDIIVNVVEDKGEILGGMTVLRATLFEDFWLKSENPGVGRALMRASIRTARHWTDDWVFAGAADEQMTQLLKRVGGIQLPMELYILALAKGALAFGEEPCLKQSY